MQTFTKAIKIMLASVLMVGMVGCTASKVAVGKRNLDVQTKMSDTIFLQPVNSDKRVVFLQIRNTSGKPGIKSVVAAKVRQALAGDGYRVTDNVNDAHYILQANILQAGRSTDDDSRHALSGGFGGAVAGAAIGSAASDSPHGGVVGGLIGAALGTVVDASVKDVTYTVITDIQISVRADKGEVVEQRTHSSMEQGSDTQQSVHSKKKLQWQRYRTRIISTANKVNLKFEEAQEQLVDGIARSIGGVF